MPIKLDIQPLTELDIQGMPKTSQTPMTQVPTSEPDTFWGGVMKSLSPGGEVDQAGAGGLKGFVKGTVDLASTVGGALSGIGESVSNPIDTIKGGWGVATHPMETARGVAEPIAETFNKSGSDPEAWGELMGQTAGQPLLTAGLSKALPYTPIGGLGRASGRGLQKVGGALTDNYPISGAIPKLFEPRILNMAERQVGRGLSNVGRRLERASAPIPKKVTAEHFDPQGQPGFTEGEIIPGLPPSRQLAASNVDFEMPGAPQDPFNYADVKQLNRAYPETPMDPQASVVGNMDSPFPGAPGARSDFTNQVLQSTDPTTPQNIFNLPENASPPMKQLGPAQDAGTRLQEMMKGMGDDTQQPTLGPVDDSMQSGPAGASDEMYDLMQRMSGGRTPPRQSSPDISDIDNEINKLIENLGKTREPKAVVNHPDLAINASGESAASLEAINRISSMTKKGESFVVYDKAGRVKPLIGPDAVDYVAKPGETYGIRSAEGFQVLENKGGRVPPTAKAPIKNAEITVQEGNKGLSDIESDNLFMEQIKAPSPTIPPKGAVQTYTVPKAKMTKEMIETAGNKGFKFIGEDAQGNYRFKKIGGEVKKKVTTPEMETVYRGGNLKGKGKDSFFTTDKTEARGYASLADRPGDRFLHKGQIEKGKYPAGNTTTGGNIPEKWANIQRVIPNSEIETAFKPSKPPKRIAQQTAIKKGTEVPTLYHGTRKNFEHFEPTGGSGYGYFDKWNLFSENPKYTEMYSLGEHEGMKRNIPSDNTGARTIAAKAKPRLVLDLTKPISETDAKIINNVFKKHSPSHIQKPDVAVGEKNVLSLISSYYKDLPYDAIKFPEHGQSNWAIKPGVDLKTPHGIPLTKRKKK